MRKLSEMILENQKSRMAQIEAKNKETEEIKKMDSKVEESYFELLKEFGVESIADLDEAKAAEFDVKLNALLESIEAEPEIEVSTETVDEAKVNEADIKTKEDFEEYAKAILKKAHGDKYDEKKAKEVIDGIIADTKDDWGAAVGKLTAGLGESTNETETEPVNESQSQLVMDFVEALDNVLSKYAPKKFGDIADSIKEYQEKIKSIMDEMEEFSSDPTLESKTEPTN